MMIQLPLSQELEAKLREHAAAAGKDLATIVREAVEELVNRDNGALPPARWSEEWHAWAAGHSTQSGTVDDSRESIYAGRGE